MRTCALGQIGPDTRTRDEMDGDLERRASSEGKGQREKERRFSVMKFSVFSLLDGRPKKLHFERTILMNAFFRWKMAGNGATQFFFPFPFLKKQRTLILHVSSGKLMCSQIHICPLVDYLSLPFGQYNVFQSVCPSGFCLSIYQYAVLSYV